MIDKSTMDRCVKDISFPIGRDELADCAAGNACPHDVVAQLKAAQVTDFRSEDDALCMLGNVGYCVEPNV